MSLQFDSGAYYALNKDKRNAEAQNAFQDLNGINQTAQTVSGIGNAMMQSRQQDRQQQMQDLMTQMKVREDNRQTQQANSDYGQPMDPNQTSVGPQAQPILGKSSFMPGGQGQVASPSPLIDRFKQWQSGGMNKASTEPDFLPSLPKDQRDQYQKNNAPITPYQQAELDQRDRAAQLSSQKLDLTTGEKSTQFDQKEWDKIVKDTDATTASGRSGLGLAVKADYNANRALMTLSKPTVTNQEAANVMADIASIYQGGSATQYGMSHQGYNTLYQKITGALQYVNGHPQDSLPDPIKQRLIGVLGDMKNTNKAVMKQQLDHYERAQPQIISKYQDQWKGIRQNLEGGIAGGPDMSQQQQGGSNTHPQDSQAVQWAKQNPQDPRAMKILQLNGGQ